VIHHQEYLSLSHNDELGYDTIVGAFGGVSIGVKKEISHIFVLSPLKNFSIFIESNLNHQT